MDEHAESNTSFSRAEILCMGLRFFVALLVPILLGTTGWTEEEEGEDGYGTVDQEL